MGLRNRHNLQLDFSRACCVFSEKLRLDGWQKLTASDRVAVESLLLNTILLIVAVVSLKIAVSSYSDALAACKNSGHSEHSARSRRPSNGP